MKLPTGLTATLLPSEHKGEARYKLSLDEVVHACPAKAETAMPCCGRTPFDVPVYHRMTLDPSLVTCGGAL